ncbi:MAG: LptA/OstA family protein, partial [Candidatus Margulisiibacteriota bacterium]
YTRAKDIIHLLGSVEMVYGPLRIVCEQLVFDRRKQELQGSKSLKAFYRSYEIEGETLIYRINQKIVDFVGMTTIHENKNVIQGKDITLDLLKNKLYSNEKTHVTVEKGSHGR